MAKRVLFVCMGNICRSPAAEGVLRHLLASRPDLDIQVDSAGTIGHHAGHAPDRRMQAAAKSRGYHLVGQARQVTRQDFRQFDLIVAMDRENFRDLQRIAEGVAPHVVLLSDYLDDQWPRDVPDPYYGGDEGFAYVLDMLEAACPYILEQLSS